MTGMIQRWTPAVLLLTGAFVTVGMDTQRALPLRASLEETLPLEIEGYIGQDQAISDEELRVVGVSDYLFRVFEPRPTGDEVAGELVAAPFSLYVGYYEQQSRGKTIHSPKNCLPGAGWEALTSTTHDVEVAGRTYTVNRYLIKRNEQRALVLYWYQGRGRVEANEYRVKLDLLKDSALRGRSDEALVRLVVPVVGTEAEALELATSAAERVIPRVEAALPT